MGSHVSPFSYSDRPYVQNVDIVNEYVDQTALYLQMNSGKPIEVCRDYVIKNISTGGKFPIKDPKVMYLEQVTRGNRKQMQTTFLEYVGSATEQKRVMAPTFTVYKSIEEKVSLLGEYVGINLKKRKEFKKNMFLAERAGDAELEAYYNILQTSRKVLNNSISGAHASPYTPLYIKSGHSTLTSTCRISTSYSNIGNEKFIMGNRHYWCPDLVFTNIVSICKHTDLPQLDHILEKYNIPYPSVESVMGCIVESCKHYWHNNEAMNDIYVFVCNLTGVQRAAFLYIADMYHLAQEAPVIVRQILGELACCATVGIDDHSIMKTLSADMVAYVSLLCSHILQGRSLDDLNKQDIQGYSIVAATATKVLTIIDNYADFISVLWRPNILPQSVATVPSMLRKAVVASDTDSTMFTAQYWTKWYTGKYSFDKQSYDIAYTMAYLASQNVIHLLAMMSANLGIHPTQIHELSMKSEYFFPTFVPTNSAKHYFNYTSAREGNVYAKPKIDVKGVELRSSNAPPEVMSNLKSYMCNIMDTVIERGSLTVADCLNPVIKQEKEILDNIMSGGYKYMRTQQIRDAASYVKGNASAGYMNYEMWQTVFAPKYGNVEPPPYVSVKVSLDLCNPTKIAAWIERMQDRGVAERMRAWLDKYGKTSINTMMLPKPILELTGIPEEILLAVETRKLVMGIMSPYYLTLETMGFYYRNDDHTRLITDDYNKLIAV